MIERLTTKDLLTHSFKDLAKTKPIDKITIKEITDNCGLSKRTFYHYFQDKSELILYEYTNNIVSVFNEENINCSWLDLMLKAVEKIVANYDYYKNAFHVFDYSSHPITRMKISANIAFENFIKLKYNVKDLTEEERVALKIYTLGIWAYAIEWIKNDMPIQSEKLSAYMISSLPCALLKYIK